MDYVGGRPATPDTTLEDKQTPFQYMERMPSKAGESLRFKHDIPNSVTDMDYQIRFQNGVDILGGDKAHINGGIAADAGSSR